jgi:hypothetical protein
MGKDAVIAGLLALPPADQREIFVLLREQLGEDPVISQEQESELDRRLDRFDREGSRGEPWEKVYGELSKARTDAHRDH